jgi:hypothetical protein
VYQQSFDRHHVGHVGTGCGPPGAVAAEADGWRHCAGYWHGTVGADEARASPLAVRRLAGRVCDGGHPAPPGFRRRRSTAARRRKRRTAPARGGRCAPVGARAGTKGFSVGAPVWLVCQAQPGGAWHRPLAAVSDGTSVGPVQRGPPGLGRGSGLARGEGADGELAGSDSETTRRASAAATRSAIAASACTTSARTAARA